MVSKSCIIKVLKVRFTCYQITLENLIHIKSYLCHDQNQQLSNQAPFIVPNKC